MIAPNYIRFIVIGSWCFLTACVILGSAVLIRDAFAKSHDAIEVSQVEYLGNTIELPQYWRERGGPRAFRREFTIDVNLDPLPKGDLYLHVPYFEQRLEVTLNGTHIFNSAQNRPWIGPISSLTSMVLLPREYLLGGSNTFALFVENGPAPVGVISRLLIGTKEQVGNIYLVRRFLNETIPPSIFGLELFLAFTSVIVFALRPQDKIFGWLGMLMLSITAISFFGFINLVPAAKGLSRYSTACVPFLGIGLLGFARMLSGGKMSVLFLPAAIALSTILAIGIKNGIPPVWLSYSVVIPLMTTCILASLFFLLKAIWNSLRLEYLLFACGLVILAMASIHDFLLRQGHLSDGIWMAQVSAILPLASIAIFIVRHQSQIASALDKSSDLLKQKLIEREEELEKVYLAQRELDQIRAIEDERTRITADLHDGVAGHLATIVALSDHSEFDPDSIRTSARNALLDIRMIIDALNVPDGTLIFFLGLFRDRCIDPLEVLGVEVEWSLAALPDGGTVAHEDALNVIRILQESVNNALRHGHLTHLNIFGREIAKGWIEITVANKSAPDASDRPAHDSSGIGLISMKNRAEVLGGTVDFRLLDQGAEVVLRLPPL